MAILAAKASLWGLVPSFIVHKGFLLVFFSFPAFFLQTLTVLLLYIGFIVFGKNKGELSRSFKSI